MQLTITLSGYAVQDGENVTIGQSEIRHDIGRSCCTGLGAAGASWPSWRRRQRLRWLAQRLPTRVRAA